MRITMINSIVCLLTLLAAAAPAAERGVSGAPAAAPTAAAIVEALGQPGGLALLVAVPDAKLAVDLAATGAWLAQVVDSDSAAVAAVRAAAARAGLTGQATALLRADLSRIPVRDRLANVVVVDLDRKGAPTRDEILRTLATNAVVFARERGAWKLWKVAPPEGLGSWSHEYCGPDWNRVCNDRVADLPAGMQWVGTNMMSRQETIRIDNGAFVQYEGFGRGVYLDKEMAVRGFGSKQRPIWLTVRDGCNGIPLWQPPTSMDSGYVNLVATRGRLFWFPHPDEPMRSADLRTGGGEKVHAAGALWSPGRDVVHGMRSRTGQHSLVIGRTLVQSWGPEVIAVDIDSGAERWRWKSDCEAVCSLAGGHDGVVYAGEGAEIQRRARFYGALKAKGIVALGENDGKVRWRATAPLGQLGQFVASPGVLAIGATAHHQWDTTVSYMAAFDAKTGRQLWIKGYNTEAPEQKDACGNTFVIVGDYVLAGSSNAVVRFDLKDGNRTQFRTAYNSGCQSTTALSDGRILFSYSPTVFSGMFGPPEQITWRQCGLVHPACGTGLIPGNGLLHAPASFNCNCKANQRVTQVYSPESAEIPVSDKDRRSTQPLSLPAADEYPFGRGMIAHDWIAAAYPGPGIYPVSHPNDFEIDAAGRALAATAGDLTVLAAVHQQAVEGYRKGRRVWRFQTEGRVAAPPLIREGRVFVAARDGWLYCLDAADGAMRWRFLAAASDRQLVNSGQLESVWPCFGVLAHEGLIWVGAGLNTELDGGLRIWGLDAEGTIHRRISVVQKTFRGKYDPERGPQAGVHRIPLPYSHSQRGNIRGGVPAETMIVHDRLLHVGTRQVPGPGMAPHVRWMMLPVPTDADGTVWCELGKAGPISPTILPFQPSKVQPADVERCLLGDSAVQAAWAIQQKEHLSPALLARAVDRAIAEASPARPVILDYILDRIRKGESLQALSGQDDAVKQRLTKLLGELLAGDDVVSARWATRHADLVPPSAVGAALERAIAARDDGGIHPLLGSLLERLASGDDLAAIPAARDRLAKAVEAALTSNESRRAAWGLRYAVALGIEVPARQRAALTVPDRATLGDWPKRMPCAQYWIPENKQSQRLFDFGQKVFVRSVTARNSPPRSISLAEKVPAEARPRLQPGREDRGREALWVSASPEATQVQFTGSARWLSVYVVTVGDTKTAVSVEVVGKGEQVLESREVANVEKGAWLTFAVFDDALTLNLRRTGDGEAGLAGVCFE